MQDKDKPFEPPASYDALLLLCRQLHDENRQLRRLLEKHRIAIPTPDLDATSAEANENVPSPETSLPSSALLTRQSPLDERIALYMSLFLGRPDVFARQWCSRDGKIGYSPTCKNEWKPGICGKPQTRCAHCPYAEYLPYDAQAVQNHLSGKQVLGIYPLLADERCGFLAIDFDEADWQKDVSSIRTVCRERGVPCSVEISRSGNGAHVWFFFEETLQASLARSFGAMLLTQAMQDHARMKFSSYDRMFPNQDTMPSGGFGNLIALPFQRAAFKNGGSIFVDEQMQPYPDQWTYLSSIKRISKGQIEEWMTGADNTLLGELRAEDVSENVFGEERAKPWLRTAHKAAIPFPAHLQAVIADRIYLPTDQVPQRAQNRIKRLAAFRNPEFYKAQAMRMPVWNKPRIICCAEYEDAWLCLPRGCRDELIALADENGIVLEWEDTRCTGRQIDVHFRGELREEQLLAFNALIAHENGVLSATTAFGKTVIGAALIAHRRVNTLILVHRAQLVQQWRERLSQFLDIREVLPDTPKRRGRRKKRELIGQYGSGKDTRSGIIDIALLQSLGNEENVKSWIGEYGMVIVDECHHVPAFSFEQALKPVRARYVYGLTATPTRKDGHHPILHMYLGPICYRVDAKAQAEKRPFEHLLIPRFLGTRFCFSADNGTPSIGQYYAQIQEDELRNHAIVDDVLACIRENRNCLILSERTVHVHRLAALLREKAVSVITLTGGKKPADTARQLDLLKNAPADSPLVICATGKYIGEGFDEARLDTLFLTMPISWHGTVAQYAGRLHRLHEGKREVRVYDYVDISAGMLERMYHRRLKGYAAIGYKVASGAADMVVSSEIIYDQDSFQPCFLKDIASAHVGICIVSPYVTLRRVRWLEGMLLDAKQRGISVSIHTRPADSFQGAARNVAETAHAALLRLGAHIVFQQGIHQKYAIIDERIVWYGSINLLNFGASQESIMRLVSGSIAAALQKQEEEHHGIDQ